MNAWELDKLSRYRLPDSVSRLAPNRYPFLGYATSALAIAAEAVLSSPERCGTLPCAVRKVRGIDKPQMGQRWTILEAHLNAERVDGDTRNTLLTMGFEQDGLSKAMPTHFRGHFTLKYKFGDGDSAKKRRCYRFLRCSCNRLIEYLKHEAPDLEYNLEIEVYNFKNRRSWNDQEARIWNGSFLFSEASRRVGKMMLLPPETSLVKRADIHAKVANDIDDDVSMSIIAALSDIGFYPVVTWSGNTILTGQFVSVSAAKKFFALITDAAEEFSGIAELTLEPTPYFFRSTVILDGQPHLAAIPPLILTHS